MLAVGPDSSPLFPKGVDAKISHHQFHQLDKLLRAARNATSYSDLFKSLGDFSREIEAGAVNCAVFDSEKMQLVGVSTTMNAASVDRYFAENLAMDDPLIPRIRSEATPALLGWGFGVTPAWQCGNSARMLEAMHKDGYHGLAYFPVIVAGSPFSTSITFRNELEPERGQAFLNSEYGLLKLAAEIVGYRAASLFKGGANDEFWHTFTPPLLSPREREILLWLANGLKTDQIAYELGLKTVTVHLHLKTARQKLGARTREQMMALAATRGLL